MPQTEEKSRPYLALIPLGCCLALVLCVFLLAKFPGKSGTTKSTEATATVPVVTTAPTEAAPATEAPALADPWALVLVSSQHPLPDSFQEPALSTLTNGSEVDSRIYPDLTAMLDGAQEAGLSPVVCSAYRSRQSQETLFSDKVQEYLDQGLSQSEAEAQAAAWVAVPGTSEHETGLALDIVDIDYQLLDSDQANTPTQKWLLAHAWEYGFILRYPEDKTELTGIDYEPWHYRYVGKDAAKVIFDEGLCLEEYLSQYAPEQINSSES